MTRVWRKLPLFMGVLLLAGICAYPQDSISARPGTINYVEGRAYLNGDEVMQRQIGRTSLNIDQYLRTADRSKAEVLLTPEVFLRLAYSQYLVPNPDAEELLTTVRAFAGLPARRRRRASA